MINLRFQFNDRKIDALRILFKIHNYKTASKCDTSASGKIWDNDTFSILSRLIALFRTRKKIKYLFITSMIYKKLTSNTWSLDLWCFLNVKHIRKCLNHVVWPLFFYIKINHGFSRLSNVTFTFIVFKLIAV